MNKAVYMCIFSTYFVKDYYMGKKVGFRLIELDIHSCAF